MWEKRNQNFLFTTTLVASANAWQSKTKTSWKKFKIQNSNRKKQNPFWQRKQSKIYISRTQFRQPSRQNPYRNSWCFDWAHLLVLSSLLFLAGTLVYQPKMAANDPNPKPAPSALSNPPHTTAYTQNIQLTTHWLKITKTRRKIHLNRTDSRLRLRLLRVFRLSAPWRWRRRRQRVYRSALLRRLLPGQWLWRRLLLWLSAVAGSSSGHHGHHHGQGSGVNSAAGGGGPGGSGAGAGGSGSSHHHHHHHSYSHHHHHLPHHHPVAAAAAAAAAVAAARNNPLGSKMRKVVWEQKVTPGLLVTFLVYC